ncbi:uncharacterized protein LOC114309062 isoform X2 [Camellia sinensis]|uniref:uncharacterized protein LOC114309062 isoform X2 n=1 Tax=Camellia sinensis TaxID=4442 RepID=UPI001036340D|nr:uncharacterized protein LOC114309062 isoform X2 [Camellia sinensis]
MASSCESGVLMTTVCQTCGDKGDLLLLVYCVQCHDSAMHRYCLDKFSPDDDSITWMCEECTAKAPQIGPSMKSERINSRKDQAVEVQNNWEKRPSKKAFSTAKRPAGMKNELFKAAKLTGCSLPNEDKFHVSFDETRGSQECRIQRRRLMLEDGDSSEEPELAKANISQSGPSVHMSYCQPSLEPDSHLYGQPVNDPIWRGCLSITSGKNETLFGLVAHISSKACSKVFDAANALPPVLNVEILPRSDVWPKSFQKLPPTDDSIALYFFPDSERDEKVFDILLDDIIEHNLALKALIGDAELLTFTSRELPQQYWRFRRKYYLWGVFRRQSSSSSRRIFISGHISSSLKFRPNSVLAM